MRSPRKRRAAQSHHAGRRGERTRMLAGPGSGHQHERGRAPWRRAARGSWRGKGRPRRGEVGRGPGGRRGVQAGQRGGTRQGRRGCQGRPLHAALQHGVVPATLGIIAVRIPGGNVIDTLGQEVTERVVDRGRRPRGLHRRGKACGEAHLAIDTTQPEGATVGRQGSAFASRSHGSASDRRKTPLFWSSMSQKHTSWGLYGMVVSHLPFYQRLTRGLCFFVKNPG